MKTILCTIKFEEFVDDTENQFCESETITRIFHTKDDEITYEDAQIKIYNELVYEFGKDRLINACEIYDQTDLKIQISKEI